MIVIQREVRPKNLYSMLYASVIQIPDLFLHLMIMITDPGMNPGWSAFQIGAHAGLVPASWKPC